MGDSLPLKDGGSLGAGGSGHTVLCGFCGSDSAWLSMQKGRLGRGQGCPAGLCGEAGMELGGGGWVAEKGPVKMFVFSLLLVDLGKQSLLIPLPTTYFVRW